ncbi:MAG: porphobilinogen synthase [Actinomycetota bacterium]
MSRLERPRRLRTTSSMRALVREVSLDPSSLMLPLFVREGLDHPRPIVGLPGVVQHSLSSLESAVDEARSVGVGSVMLFGVPETRDAEGSEAWNPDGILSRAIAVARRRVGDDLVVAADLCLDEFTSHGHCGVLDEHGVVDNDRTLDSYARMSIVLADAGAHLLGTSGMMDGQVRAVREALDAAGRVDVAIIAYTAKFASSFYGPFRAAVESPLTGDRATYQQDFANVRESMREARLDVGEGADIIMVKPGLAYLDVLSAISAAVDVPTASYIVSGETAMVEAAAATGALDRDRAILEMVTAVRRAGATVVCTYWAVEVARRLARSGT